MCARVCVWGCPPDFSLSLSLPDLRQGHQEGLSSWLLSLHRRKLRFQEGQTLSQGETSQPTSPALAAEDGSKAMGLRSGPAPQEPVAGISFHRQRPHGPELPRPGLLGQASEIKGHMQGADAFSHGLLPGLAGRKSAFAAETGYRRCPHTVTAWITMSGPRAGCSWHVRCRG